ncbi:MULTISPECIES: type II toxin-antitoxin system prevent-host-death family antitoxin [unclassified Nonomuraea]|uniref:type II toxin-antitoxin system prevent-host-death family antitoxin n=1 Tax=unclassified Nonomuraea TaxID=2593643 RepID=UPI00340E55B0
MSDTALHTELVARIGAPLGVEEARAQWGRLLRAAQAGDTTLITRERWEWAALIPVSEVSGPLTGLAALPVSTARRKLGELVRQAAQPYDDGPLLLTRHRAPAAALVSARYLAARHPADRHPADRQAAGNEAREHRLVAEELLRDGRTILLSHLPGEEGPAFSAVARDRDGADVAAGNGDSVEQALRRLRPSG